MFKYNCTVKKILIILYFVIAINWAIESLVMEHTNVLHLKNINIIKTYLETVKMIFFIQLKMDVRLNRYTIISFVYFGILLKTDRKLDQKRLLLISYT